jgi:hypothetical protein
MPAAKVTPRGFLHNDGKLNGELCKKTFVAYSRQMKAQGLII